MMLVPLFPERVWKVRLSRTKPRDYEKARAARTSADGKAHFYMILSRKEGRTRIHYIGKTYKSEVWVRLNQADHQWRIKELREDFPKSEWLVSHGVLDLNTWKAARRRYPSPKRIDEIESILIHANHVKEGGINRRKQKTYGITDHYLIINCGNYIPLKRKVYLTLVEETCN